MGIVMCAGQNTSFIEGRLAVRRKLVDIKTSSYCCLLSVGRHTVDMNEQRVMNLRPRGSQAEISG